MNKGINGIDIGTVPTSMETKGPDLLDHLSLGIYDKQKIFKNNLQSHDTMSYFLKKLGDNSLMGLIGRK